MVIAILDGYAPLVAVEFGRQRVPTTIKPSFIELENFIRELRREDGGVLGIPQDVVRALDRFYLSLNAQV